MQMFFTKLTFTNEHNLAFAVAANHIVDKTSIHLAHNGPVFLNENKFWATHKWHQQFLSKF